MAPDPEMVRWMRSVDERFERIQTNRPTLAPPDAFDVIVHRQAIGVTAGIAPTSTLSEVDNSRFHPPKPGRWAVIYTVDFRITSASAGQVYVARIEASDQQPRADAPSALIGLEAAIRTTITVVDIVNATAGADIWLAHIITGGAGVLEQGISRVTAWRFAD